jgi:ADP-ribosylation factor-like protein 5B
MGFAFSKLWQGLFSEQKNFKIIIVGLNNAGKTTILYKLHLGEVVVTQPTIGSNVEEITYKNVQFQVWDLGGQEKLRPSWREYFTDTNAVIMVIDSSERERVDAVKKELETLLSHEDLREAALCVFANKQDLKGSMPAAEISDALSLHSIKTHDWHIQPCCALTGDGISQGLDWIVARMNAGAT